MGFILPTLVVVKPTEPTIIGDIPLIPEDEDDVINIVSIILLKTQTSSIQRVSLQKVIKLYLFFWLFLSQCTLKLFNYHTISWIRRFYCNENIILMFIITYKSKLDPTQMIISVRCSCKLSNMLLSKTIQKWLWTRQVCIHSL